MKVGSAFPSRYIKVEDLQGRRISLTIDHVTVEQVGRQNDQKQTKPIVFFVGKSKGLALNRINATTISAVLGTDETEEWRGKRIVLFPDKTMYGNKLVDCIRVAAPMAAPAPAPPAVVQEDFVPSDDDVAFLNG